jgi:hypothetical protein
VGRWGGQACAGSWSSDDHLAAKLDAAQAMEALMGMQRRSCFDSPDALRSYDEVQLMTIPKYRCMKLHGGKYSQVARHCNEYKEQPHAFPTKCKREREYCIAHGFRGLHEILAAMIKEQQSHMTS